MAAVVVATLGPSEPAVASETTAASAPAALPEVPMPAIDNLEAYSQEQLREAKKRLDTVLEESDDPVLRSEAFGYLGKLLYVYDLTAAARVSFANARDLYPEEPSWHYLLGAIDQLDGRHQEAAASFSSVLELEPGDVPARIRLGNSLYDLDRLDEAEAAFLAVLETEPRHPSGLFGLGKVELARGWLEGAIAHLEEALAIQPTATTIHHQLGLAYRRAGDLDRAREHLAKNSGVRVQFLDPRIQNLSELLKTSHVFFKAGVDAARQGRFEEAIRQFQLAVAEEPDGSFIHYNLALAYLHLGRRPQAVESLERSVEFDPEFRNGHFNLGTLAAEDGRLSDAERHFRRAVEIDADDLEAHLEWVVALSRLDRLDDAAGEVAEILRRDPENPRARLQAGVLAARSGRLQAARANLEAVLDNARAEPQGRAEAHAQLGLVFERAGSAAAEEHLRAAAELEPVRERLEPLALWLGRSGRFAEAAEVYERILSAGEADKDERVFVGLAMANLLGRRDLDARRALERGLESLPGNLTLGHLLARVLAAADSAEVRDGPRSLDLSQRIFQLAPSLEHAETVAMAFAELGRFEEAMDWQRKVIERAGRLGGEAMLPAARERLAGYDRGEPCRSPWR